MALKGESKEYRQSGEVQEEGIVAHLKGYFTGELMKV